MKGARGDPEHRDGKLFRRRFFFDFASVHAIVAKCKEAGLHTEGNDAMGRSSSPLALLVLGAMRVLTRNVTFDDVAEQTFISEVVHRVFFPKFVEWYARVVFPEVVHLPALDEVDANGAELISLRQLAPLIVCTFGSGAAQPI